MSKWLSAIALAGLLPTVQAATWNFSYDNLQPDAGVPWTITGFSGSFTGVDRNLDHLITADEITAMEIDFPAGGSTERDAIVPNHPVCLQPTSECAGIRAFSFDPHARTLTFDVWFNDWNWGFEAVTGSDIRYYAPTGDTRSTWTDQTTFSIDRVHRVALAEALPVPEPSTAWLCGAGLAMLAVWQRSRRPAAAPARVS
jgi:hypothetical protein